MGILGRRRARKPVELNIDWMELLRRQLASPDPALRLLAEEAQILAFEGENAAPGTVYISRRFTPLKPAEMLGRRDHPIPIQNGSAGMPRNAPSG